MSLIEKFKAARAISLPILCITGPDPAATIETLCAATNGEAPKLRWDRVRGLVGLNEAGAAIVAELIGEQDPVAATAIPVDALSLMLKMREEIRGGKPVLVPVVPKGTILFMLQTHRYVNPQLDGSEAVAQAIWNLREPFKATGRLLVLLAPGIDLPVELQQDVTILDEPLPTPEALEAIVRAEYRNFEFPEPKKVEVGRAVDALRGLAAFPAGTATAMNMDRKRKTVDLEGLWERKRQMIGQTRGLSVWQGPERYDLLGGVENAKLLGQRIRDGNGAPRALVFADEFEKAMAGSQGGDTSGSARKNLGMVLTEMQDMEYEGIMAIGHPGCSKSAWAKATGTELGVPTIVLDLPGVEASLVGESAANLRQVFKVIRAVSDGAALWVATCNSIGELPPELKRRFPITLFFDLPTEEEQALIWPIYEKKYQLEPQERPPHFGWTGAEIKKCCKLAWQLRCSLLEAAKFIVPVAVASADKVKALRQMASGKFINASAPGIYRWTDAAVSVAPTTGRTVRQED